MSDATRRDLKSWAHDKSRVCIHIARRGAARHDKKSCRVDHKNKDASVQPVSGSIRTNREYYSDGAIIVDISIDIVTMPCIQEHPEL